TIHSHSRKRRCEARSGDARAASSPEHLDALISCAIVFVHHTELLREAEKAFGVANEEIAAGIQAVIKLVDEALLLGFIEIDHDVTTKNDVVAARQEFCFEIMEVELDEFFELRLNGVLVVGLFEVAEAAGVIDRLHLLFGVEAFLTGAQTRITDIRSENFELPGRRNQRFRGRHIKRQRIAEIVVSQSVADKDGNGIGFLPAGATGAPDAKSPIAAFLFLRRISSKTDFCKRSSCGRLRKKLVSLTVRFSRRRASSALPSRLVSKR